VLAIHHGITGRVTEGADAFAVDGCAVRLCTVFHNLEALFFCKGADCFNIGRLAGDVRHNNGAGVRRICLFDALKAHIEAAGGTVRDDRDAVHHHDRHQSARIGDRTADDLGERLNIQRTQGNKNGGGAAVDGIGISAAHHFCKFLAEDFFLASAISGGNALCNRFVDNAVTGGLFLCAKMMTLWQLRWDGLAAAIDCQRFQSFAVAHIQHSLCADSAQILL